MKREVMLLFTVLFALAAFAGSTNDIARLSVAERKAAFLRATGGFVIDRRNEKGAVVIVNAQTRAKRAYLESAAATFALDAQLTVKVEDGTFDLAAPAVKGEATVFVVDDPRLPMSLLAPEAKWALVNIAPLVTEREPFFRSRVEREIVRALVPILAGADSQYPLCLMSAVTKPEDLDRFMDARLPIDVLDRIRKNLGSFGLGRWEKTSYRNAVLDGWASAPTNEIQQAVWDRVKAERARPPTKGHRIRYDQTRGK